LVLQVKPVQREAQQVEAGLAVQDEASVAGTWDWCLDS
jgi:hypothetical protein